jgi:signal transduction histidine kinase
MTISDPPGGRPPSWWRRRGVRARTTTGACLVVGAALLLGGLLLIWAVRTTLTADVVTTAGLRAQSITDVLEAGTAPADLGLVDDEDWLVQVVTADGVVVAASPRLRGRPAVADPLAGRSFVARRLPTSDGCPCQVLTRATGDGRYVVLVAQTLDPVTEGTAVVGTVLAAGVPLLVLLVGATNWRVVGRALRPVDAIRRRVGEITETQLAQRVPMPPSDDEVARLAGTMNQMLDRLQAARDRQRRFVSDASHELRSPIATIRHELEVAAAHPQDTDFERLVTDIAEETQRLQHLVDGLLLLARADEQPSPAARRPVDLDDLLLAEAARLRSYGRVRVDSTGIGAGRVTGDPDQLARMIRNLTDNAARHARTRIVLALTATAGAVRLAVANDGPAIAGADRERIFERFTRLDGARGRTDGGFGLGLAIVAAVARSHGGRVQVTDASGDTEFVVTLPRDLPPEAARHDRTR